jgi:hypothetical protein
MADAIIVGTEQALSTADNGGRIVLTASARVISSPVCLVSCLSGNAGRPTCRKGEAA